MCQTARLTAVDNMGHLCHKDISVTDVDTNDRGNQGGD